MQSISFDIITAPDLLAGSRLYGLKGLEQHAIPNVMLYKQRQQSDEALPLYLQRLVAVSLVIAEGSELSHIQLQSKDEAQLLRELFAILDSESCRIYWQQASVLALLQFRALRFAIPLPQDWPMPATHHRRAMQCGWFDLRQMLAVEGGENSLSELASLMALPLPSGMATGQCREIESATQLAALQQGCLANARHIYLLYLRLAFIQGVLCEGAYQAALELVRLNLKSVSNQ